MDSHSHRRSSRRTNSHRITLLQRLEARHKSLIFMLAVAVDAYGIYKCVQMFSTM